MNKFNQLARKLRKTQTKQEQKIWSIIRNRQLLGYKFKRQYPIGSYIVDFVCKDQKLVVEIDGGQHNTDDWISYDKQRTDFIENAGFKIIRFWNSDVDNNIDEVCNVIINALESQPSPQPSPKEREL